MSLRQHLARTWRALPPGRRRHPYPGGRGARLLNEVLWRRAWALHRHVHLVAAFEEAFDHGHIRRALSIGCGAGLSELYLAAHHPDVEFTLTDVDEERLAVGKRRVEDLAIENVRFRSLDLLQEPTVDDGPYDWVSSIEVLEHIEDDATAAQNLLAHSRDWFWILVPQCAPEALHDEREIRRAWESCEHHRPGYTPETLASVLDPDVDVWWLRSCYQSPDADELRRRMREASDDELVDRRHELVAAAYDDLAPPPDAPGQGIEVLGRVPAAARA